MKLLTPTITMTLRYAMTMMTTVTMRTTAMTNDYDGLLMVGFRLREY